MQSGEDLVDDRQERKLGGGLAADSAFRSSAGFPTDSSSARGLGNTLPGSSGRPSGPPTTKLLYLPPLSRAAHRAGKSAAALTKACGNGATTPLRLVTGARISTVPWIPKAEEALTRLAGSRRNTSDTMRTFPPGPPKASARIWLPSKMTNLGSIVMFPPLPTPLLTVAVS